MKSIRFLWTHEGRPSSSKFWKSVAYAVGTYIVILNAKGLSYDLLLVYLAVVGGSELGTRLIEAKISSMVKKEEPK